MPRSSFSFKKALHLAVNFLMPPFCPGCGEYLGINGSAGSLCHGCRSGLEAAVSGYSHWAQSPRDLDGLWSLAPYGSEPITTLIHKIKYQSKDWLLECLNPVISQYLTPAGFDGKTDGVAPVPLHPSRRRQRGFNQAELIGGFAAARLRKPFYPDALVKIKKTKAQMGISHAGQRRRNVAGSIGPEEKYDWSGRRILLVDDVYTTGATMSECAKVLRRRGALKVFGFTLARA